MVRTTVAGHELKPTSESSVEPSVGPIIVSVAREELEPVEEVNPPPALVDAARGK